jgi:methylglutaconyl-CoA hydratase
MSDSDLVLYELCGPVATLTLNRPDRRNALSQPLIKALGMRFERARADQQVRCVILTGSGTTFCAGMDLAELQESVAPTAAQDEASVVWQDALRLAQLFDLIYTFPKPTIAAVNGAAVAGGAGLTTVCDLAVASPNAKFGYPEVRRGLVAAMVMPHLLRHVGERMARYLFLTGEMIDASAALEAGLINAVAPQEDLIATASRWAEAVAAGGPLAIEKTKELLQIFSHQALSVEQVAQASAAPRLTEECREGLAAFFEKRQPPWGVSSGS